jgi:hypothetical protein
MHRPLLASASTSLAALLLTAAVASEPQGQQHPCTAVRVASERLACYDQAFGLPAEHREPPVAAAAAAKAGQDFGFSEAEKRARTTDADKTDLADRLEAVVAGIGRHGTGEMIVTLDNGQVWMQAESVTSARLRVGDRVTIRKASMGSYQLLTPVRIAMRVRRVK